MLARMWRKGSTLLVRMEIGAATVEDSTEVSQNTKNGTTTWPSNSTPGHISGKKKKTTKTLIQKDTCTPMFTAALFKIARYGRNLSVYQQMNGGSSLGVQWLWFRAFTPMALGSIPDQGTKIL